MEKKLYTMLIVEDSVDDAFLIKRAFNKAGILNPIQVVVDGDEAISYLSGAGEYENRQIYPFPQFIITDLKMPRCGGFEILQWMKKNSHISVIPTIVWSSSKQPDDVRKAYELGATSYVVKPSDFTELQQMIRRIYDYWEHCEKPYED